LKRRLHAVGIGVTILALMSSNLGICADHTVQKGDTLYSLARKNGVSVDDIKRANQLGGKPIKIGQTLTIPSSERPVDKKTEATSPDKEKAKVAEALVKRFGPRISVQPSPDTPGDPAVALTALAYRGAPYVHGGTGGRGFDCSGFTRHVYARFGVRLPHHAGSQAGCGQSVGRDEMKPGDLVFFQTHGRHISHVGIYVGEGKFIHASTPRRGVIVSSLSEKYYSRRFRGARRVAPKV
jgi:peptidoglycan endopeptidase LytE